MTQKPKTLQPQALPPKTLLDHLPGDKLAAFQQWFSDSIPHNKALGLAVTGVGHGQAAMRLDWQEHLVGNPTTGVIHGGAITAMLDACSGMSVATLLTDPAPFATLDLRIDYTRPAVPRQPVYAEAECYRLTSNVAFTRALAHQGDRSNPVAAASGTFMMGTKGKTMPANRIGEALAGARKPREGGR